MNNNLQSYWIPRWCSQLDYDPADFNEEDDGSSPFAWVPISVLTNSGCNINFEDFKNNRWVNKLHGSRTSETTKPNSRALVSKLTPNLTEKRGVIRKCDVCDKTFSRWGNLRAHQQTHALPRLQCTQPGCFKKFQTQQTLTQHLNAVHLKQKLKCKICGKEYLFRGSLYKHAQSHHRAKRNSKEKKRQEGDKKGRAANVHKRNNCKRKVKQVPFLPTSDSSDVMEIDSLNNFP